MPSRRNIAATLYPFSPVAEDSRDYVSGIQDAFFIIEGATVLPSALVLDPNYKTCFCVLARLVVGASNIYTFYAVADGQFYQRTFTVAPDAGLVRIASAESADSWLICDTDRLYRTAGTYDLLFPCELEPGRLVWRLEEVTSIKLFNEFRDHDPARRVNLSNNVVAEYKSGDTLSLVDGWNCELTYDPDTATLTVTGFAGGGKGLPTEFPWDTNPPDYFTGIRSINGVNNGGQFLLETGVSILASYGDSQIDIMIRANT